MTSIKEALDNRSHLPSYLEYADGSFEGKFLRLPERAELSQDIDEKQIVEFYNR